MTKRLSHVTLVHVPKSTLPGCECGFNSERLIMDKFHNEALESPPERINQKRGLPLQIYIGTPRCLLFTALVVDTLRF